MNPLTLARLLCSALALGAVAPLAHAATFTVTRFDDPIPNGCAANDCSLREAVIEANATAVPDTIVLGAGTYELFQTTLSADDALSFDLDVTQDLSIVGQGRELTVIRNATGIDNQHSRVLSIVGAEVTLSALSIRDGSVYSDILPIFGSSMVGACLYASGAVLSLNEVDFSQCRMDAPGGKGAAVFLGSTTATLSGVRVRDNANLHGQGGGIALINSSLDLAQVEVSANTAWVGGGIYGYGDVLMTGDAVEVTGNSAQSCGGLYFGTAGTAVETVIEWSTDSRVAGNSAVLHGGGICVVGGAVVGIAPVADAAVDRGDLLLIEDNHAGGNGGGLWVAEPAGVSAPGFLTARRIALRGNTAGTDGGGAYSLGRLILADSEIAANSAAADGGGAWIGGEAAGNLIDRVSLVGNVAGSDGGAVVVAGDAVKLRNVSSYGNQAQSYGGGVLVSPRRSADLVHLTSMADVAASGGSLAVGLNGTATARNSVFAAGCYTRSASMPFGGSLVDAGGNAQQKGQPACAGAAVPAAKLGLQYGYFGGRFDVVGLGSGSVLREFAPILSEARVDVRGWQRRALADAGAFEFDGL